jgi:hypothetical protein
VIREKNTLLIVILSLLTALTLAGSLVLSFTLVNWMVETFGETEDLLEIIPRAFLVLFAIPMAGGAAWGFGIALLMKADTKNLTKTGALTWGLSVLAAGLVLYIIMAFGPQIMNLLPFSLSIHTFFNLLFVPTLGIVTALVVRKIIGALEMEDLKGTAGRNSGIAAALGFLIVSLVLQFGFGWEVGRPVPGRYSMITIMHWGNFAAALAGGATMGVTLVRERKEIEDSEPGNIQAKSSDLAPAAKKPASSYDA